MIVVPDGPTLKIARGEIEGAADTPRMSDHACPVMTAEGTLGDWGEPTSPLIEIHADWSSHAQVSESSRCRSTPGINHPPTWPHDP